MAANNYNKKKVGVWTCRNKVLLGTSKKNQGRNPNFDSDETKLLIELWGDPVIQKQLITTHKKSPVIEKIALSMREKGYFRSSEEINTRIKNLKCLYNRLKKEVQGGSGRQPYWKHYKAMDAVLNRPIFGKPAAEERLRLQKLQNQNNSYFTNEKRNVFGIEDDIFNMDDDDEDDDEFGDDDEDDDDDECDDEDVVDVGNDAVRYYEYNVKQEKNDEKIVKLINNRETSDTSKINESVANCDIPIKLEDPLIIPKEEPIDVDEEEDIMEINVSDANGGQFKITPVKTNSPSVTTTSTKISAPPTTFLPQSSMKLSPFVVTSTTTTAQAGKFSLVPTNKLLKPQAQQANITFKPQQILYTNAGPQSKPLIHSTSNSISVPISTTGSNGMPMKLLLVNRIPQSRPTEVVTTSSVTSTPQLQPTLTQMRPKPGQSTNVEPPKAKTTEGIRKSTLLKHKSTIGFRLLLNQLIQAENQNIDLNRKRLQLERQRLEFEKSVADRLFSVLPNLLNGSVFKKEE